MNHVTGSFELNVKELEDNLGIMAHSSQCCASGTCEVNGRCKMTTITLCRDNRDPLKLIENYGPLI